MGFQFPSVFQRVNFGRSREGRGRGAKFSNSRAVIESISDTRLWRPILVAGQLVFFGKSPPALKWHTVPGRTPSHLKKDVH
jgi:hypothetical protein